MYVAWERGGPDGIAHGVLDLIALNNSRVREIGALLMRLDIDADNTEVAPGYAGPPLKATLRPRGELNVPPIRERHLLASPTGDRRERVPRSPHGQQDGAQPEFKGRAAVLVEVAVRTHNEPPDDAEEGTTVADKKEP